MWNITIKKEDYFKLLSENILIKDIYIKNNLKNYNLLKKLVKLLAMTNKLLSAREIHKILNYNKVAVSHITVIEYLDHILKSWLVTKVFRTDLKLEKTSTWKAKYLFTFANIRNAILNWKIEKHILNENIVYEALIKLWNNKIYTWKNWTFNFTFISWKNIIHISSHSDKNEIKKEINKLKKIEGNYDKYLIVNSIKEIWIRPSTYLPIKVLEIEDFIKEIK
jgi:predicted Zn-ribbon and HTH transcriptional regulator